MKPRCEVCGCGGSLVKTLKNGAQICTPCQDTFRAVFRIQRRPCKHLPKKRSNPRRGPMRDIGYRRWCRYQECVVATHGTIDGCPVLSNCPSRQIDPMHTENNGMGSKGPDSSCVPGCRTHHRAYDSGRKAFEQKYGLDMRKLAAEYYAEYLKEKG